MSDTSIRVVEPAGYFVGAALAGVGPAIGAAVADKHPVIGAIAGSAAANTAMMGLAYGMSPNEPKESVWPYILKATAITGTGGAIGAAIADQRPALGAFIGAVLAAGTGYALYRLNAPPSKASGQISGVPCNALARVSAGAFP